MLHRIVSSKQWHGSCSTIIVYFSCYTRILLIYKMCVLFLDLLTDTFYIKNFLSHLIYFYYEKLIYLQIIFNFTSGRCHKPYQWYSIPISLFIHQLIVTITHESKTELNYDSTTTVLRQWTLPHCNNLSSYFPWNSWTNESTVDFVQDNIIYSTLLTKHIDAKVWWCKALSLHSQLARIN